MLRSVEPDLGLDLFNERFVAVPTRSTSSSCAPRGSSRRRRRSRAELATFDPPARSDAVRTRKFASARTPSTVDTMRLDRVDEVVELGSTEVWEITNEHSQPHNFHPHLVQFAVLTVDGEATATTSARVEGAPSTCRPTPRCG